MTDATASSVGVRVTLGVTVDLEPMLRASIRAAKRQHLGIDEVTETDMQKAREAFGASTHREQPAPDPAVLERIRKGLPAGVTLVELLETRDGSTSTSGTVLQVADLAVLPTIVLDNSPDGGQPPARPFEKFVVARQGTTLSVVGALEDPGVGVDGGDEANPLFSSVKMWLKLELPSKPAHHDARRAEANTLIWELVLGADLKAKGGRQSVPVNLRLELP
jgi:hypothetical protein